MTNVIQGIDYKVEVYTILQSHKKLWNNNNVTVCNIIHLWLEAQTKVISERTHRKEQVTEWLTSHVN